MAVETLRARTARVELNSGTDSEGVVQTVNVSLGTLSGDANDWNADKLLAIVAKLQPCLSKSVESLDTVATYQITAGS